MNKIYLIIKDDVDSETILGVGTSLDNAYKIIADMKASELDSYADNYEIIEVDADKPLLKFKHGFLDASLGKTVGRG